MEHKHSLFFIIILFLLIPWGSIAIENCNSGWIVGKVTNIVDDSPIYKAKVEILRQEVEKLPDGSYSVKSVDEAVPLGIIEFADRKGSFEVNVPLAEEPNYFVVIVQALGYQKILNMLTYVKPKEKTVINFELIPSQPTSEELKIIEKKLEEKKRKARELDPHFYQQQIE